MITAWSDEDFQELWSLPETVQLLVMSLMMKNSLIIVTVIIIVSGCATSSIPVQALGMVKPEGIPPINDPIWLDISSWPKVIKKGDVEYHVHYQGKNTDNKTVFDLKGIDTQFHYRAHYEPVLKAGHKYKDEDYEFGPFFGWRPDGSIFLKQMCDENQNHEFYYFYKNGQIAQQFITDFKNDIYSEVWFDEIGNIVGESTIQYRWTWYRKMKQSCEWEGKSYPDFTDCEFIKNGNNFISENKHKIW